MGLSPNTTKKERKKIKRERKHPITDIPVGGEIDYGDSWDEIQEHALGQLEKGEEIGLIVVAIVKPKSPNVRRLYYTALKPGANGKPRGYRVKTNPSKNNIDKVETLTWVHHNPWEVYDNGTWIWCC